jgi:5S rRNA maturation endonuclease (ribonuclease M5)
MSLITYDVAVDALIRIEPRHKIRPNYVEARCPAHGGKDALNLHITPARDGSGAAVFKCHSHNCKPKDIIKALGLWVENPILPQSLPAPILDLHVDPISPKVEVARYDIPYKGELLTKVRYEPKTFSWFRNGNAGLGGLSTIDVPLYGYEQISDAEPCFVTEGERDRDSLVSLGFKAVATTTGAPTIPSDDVLKPLLRAGTVYLWPDNDEQGKAHMNYIGHSLIRLGHSDVKIINWKDAPEKGDASDAICSGVDIPSLLTTARKVRKKRLGVRSEAEWISVVGVEAEPITWLAEPRIPKGKVIIIQGDPATYKSHIGLSIAAGASTGGRAKGSFPNWNSNQSGVALIVNGEDGLADTILPRLQMLGANLANIRTLSASSTPDFVLDEVGVVELEDAIDTYRPSVVVIDPFFSFVDPAVNTSAEVEARKLLKVLTALAQEYGCTIILVRHLNKDSTGRSAYRGSNSIAYQAVARGVLLTGYSNEHDEYALVHEKSNISEYALAITYGYVEGVFTWGTTSTITAEDFDTKPPKKAVDDAATFLQNLLADAPKPANDVYEAAKANDPKISKRTLERAKQYLQATSLKISGIWHWQLPTSPTIPEGNFGDLEQTEGGISWRREQL